MHTLSRGLTFYASVAWQQPAADICSRSPRPAASPMGCGTEEVCEPGCLREDRRKVPCFVALGRGCRSSSLVHLV